MLVTKAYIEKALEDYREDLHKPDSLAECIYESEGEWLTEDIFSQVLSNSEFQGSKGNALLGVLFPLAISKRESIFAVLYPSRVLSRLLLWMQDFLWFLSVIMLLFSKIVPVELCLITLTFQSFVWYHGSRVYNTALLIYNVVSANPEIRDPEKTKS